MNANLFETDFTTSSTQAKIVAWVDQLKSDLGNREKWEQVCLIADLEMASNPVDVSGLLDVFNPFINRLPPGHDAGHLYRDLINSAILYKHTNAAYESDRFAGLVAGTFHDIGNSLVARYQDRKYGAGHAEMGAYLFYHVTSGMMGENLRSLVAYAICAHTHYLKEMVVEIPAGYSRSPYWDELWEIDGKLCGVAMRITRMADRLDTNGITLLVRHILSRCDKYQEGGDISGGQWVTLNAESLTQVFNPRIRDPFGKPPTSFEHVLNFRRSNFGATVYSRDDYLFPVFDQMLNFKLSQLDRVITSLDDEQTPALDLVRIEGLLIWMSRSDQSMFRQTLEFFNQQWNQLTAEDQIRWGRAFYTLAIEYASLLKHYRFLADGHPLMSQALDYLD